MIYVISIGTWTETRQALFEHVKTKPEMSVDDMLWWLYDTHQIVVGTRTIRRVFERKGDKAVKTTKPKAARKGRVIPNEHDDDDDDDDDDSPIAPHRGNSMNVYQSPYGPQIAAQRAEMQLAQALQLQTPHPTYAPTAPMLEEEEDLPDDEETIQLQLQQIALQKREIELKLKMRRLQHGKARPSGVNIGNAIPQALSSSLYNPAGSVGPTTAKRDSRSKKKIEESQKRTAERQERMLRELERRSRRRDHLTAEWVQSKDIWPLRAQGLLADLMHQYGCYTYAQTQAHHFDTMYQTLYELVDLSKGDWNPPIHDELLRERMKRKMAQLRTKMQKTGEIVNRPDAYGGVWQKSDDYTGEAAGAAVGEENDVTAESSHAQAGAQQQMHDEQIQYEALQSHQHHQAMQHGGLAYGAGMMQQHAPSQYPTLMSHQHQAGMMPYGDLAGHDGMVM